MHKNLLKTLFTFAFLLLVSAGIYLDTTGYRISKEDEIPIDFKRTGIIGVKSIPDGANVYINGVLKTATDDTISGLDPNTYSLKITKNGFVDWQKDVEVFAELATDITAVLVSKTPRLEPLTNTGAREPVISPTLTKLAYFSSSSNEDAEPGIWIIPLTNYGLSLFRSEPFIAIEDTADLLFSQGKSILWSPDEKQLLVESATGDYFIIDLETQAVRVTPSPEGVRDTWDKQLVKKRTDFVEKLELPEEIKLIAVAKDTVWAPDENKFLYTVTRGTQTEYHVYNMEDPLPVGEKVDTVAFVTNTADPQPAVSWYTDSFHLILTEGNIADENKGQISLIRIDGTNRTEIYNNTMYSNKVYSSPGGDKLIFLTSYKSDEQTDLYTVSIR